MGYQDEIVTYRGITYSATLTVLGDPLFAAALFFRILSVLGRVGQPASLGSHTP